MRTWMRAAWQCGAVAIGLLASACGGGQPEARVTAQTTRTTRTTGAETAPRAEIVEVDESRLPITTTVGAMATRAGEAPQPQLPLTSREGAETARPPQTWAAERSMTSRPGEMRAAESELPPGERATAETHALPIPESVEMVEARGVEVTIDDICPTDVPSLRVQARNLPRGIALVLTATGEEDVASLREHMRQFALLHAMEKERQAGVAAGEMIAPSASGRPHIADPASPLARVDDLRLVEIPNGVRVELREHGGADRASVRELRASVREDASWLREGVCPLSFQIA